MALYKNCSVLPLIQDCNIGINGFSYMNIFRSRDSKVAALDMLKSKSITV